MAEFKCNTCGDTLEFKEGDKRGKCPSCGNIQTLPRDVSVEMSRRFEKARRLRMEEMDFDKAMMEYEEILSIDPDDPEANWGMVLCQYGILHEEENGKFIPTLNRMKETSILESGYYKKAYDNAETDDEKETYQREAEYISGVQKKYFSVAKKEKPYDVFISYKDKVDGTEEKTEDHGIADEIFKALVTEESFNVFFSDVTLKNKAGEFEPYIYAAMESTPVMVVIGTKPEYVNAKWVRNEWQRYLMQINNGADKVIIPVIKGMDLKDLPVELAKYQVSDLSSASGFHNLIEKIKNVVNERKKKAARISEAAKNGSGIDAMKPMIFENLMKGNWQNAEFLIDNVLSKEYYYAEGYLARIMIERRIRSKAELEKSPEPLSESRFYKSMMQYATKSFLDEINTIEKRIEKNNFARRQAAIYADASQRFQKITNKRQAELAEAQFKRISGYKDADEKVLLCRNKVEEYEDSGALMIEQDFQNEASREKKKRISMIVSAAAGLILFLAVFIMGKLVYPAQLYNEAKALIASGSYDRAYQILAELGKDDEILENKFDRATDALDRKDYDTAYSLLAELGDYEDSYGLMQSNMYDRAKQYIEGKDYDAAYTLLEELGGYKDAAEILNTNRYDRANAYTEDGDYEQAIELYEALGTYEDSKERLLGCCLAYADDSYQSGDYGTAYKMWDEAGTEEAVEAAAVLREEYPWVVVAAAEVGESVEYGRFEQNGDEEDGKEPVRWIVLSADNERALLLSEKCLEKQPFNHPDLYSAGEDYKWENCILRNRMTGDMYSALFNESEASRIQADQETGDRIFLLSLDEYNMYYPVIRAGEYTEYAARQDSPGEYTELSDAWWLRTMKEKNSPYYVSNNDAESPLNDETVDVRQSSGIRPAIWVDISAVAVASGEAE